MSSIIPLTCATYILTPDQKQKNIADMGNYSENVGVENAENTGAIRHFDYHTQYMISIPLYYNTAVFSTRATAYNVNTRRVKLIVCSVAKGSLTVVLHSLLAGQHFVESVLSSRTVPHALHSRTESIYILWSYRLHLLENYAPSF